MPMGKRLGWWIKSSMAIGMVMPWLSAAHPISISSVAVNVREDTVLANMKIMLEDLVLYQQLEAGPQQRFAAEVLQQAAAAHQDFLLQYFTVHDGAGQRLPGTLLRLELAEIPAEGVVPSQLMARNVFYHFAFPMRQRPEFLTFTQSFGGPAAVLPAVMELVVFQNGGLVQRPTQLLQGKPLTVSINWQNPPSAHAQDMVAYQARKQEEFRQQLGISSYSGLYSFLYLTNHEVRHEILMPLLTLEKWLPVQRAGTEFFEVAEQEAARDAIVAFFRDRNPVQIDGIAVTPVVKRLQFFGLDMKDFAQDAPPRQLSVYQARLGIILSYATKGAPEQVRVTWDTFHTYAPFLRSVVYAHDRDPGIQTFEKQHPHFVWKREGVAAPAALLPVPTPTQAPMWSLPVYSLGAGALAVLCLGLAPWQRAPTRWRLASLGCVVLAALGWPAGRLLIPSPLAPVPALTTDETQAVSLSVLRNIYRAFDYQSESDIYDVLARSVDGHLLSDLYAQIYKSLHVQEQGGAVAQVTDVALQDCHQTAWHAQGGQPTLGARCRWQVTGTVEHWGHIHSRTNAYEAALRLNGATGQWKLTGYDILSEQHLRSETGLRTAKQPG